MRTKLVYLPMSSRRRALAELSVYEYREADEAEVLECLRMALGVSETLPHTPTFWAWKHFENPFGESLILVARSGNEVAGLRAYLSWQFLSPNGPLKAYRAVDTATHPDHQRKGVFRALTQEANRRAEASGIDLIFNTPNAKSLPGYLSMGWSQLGKPRAYVKPLRLAFFGNSHEKGHAADDPLSFGTDVHYEPEIPGRPPLGLRTPRSVEYMQWRYQRHPTVAYRMMGNSGGQLIIRANRRAGRSEIVVSEHLGATGDLFRSLTHRNPADYLVAVARPGSPDSRTLLRSGFVPAFGRGLTLVSLPLTGAGKAGSTLGAWDLSAGDLELM